MGDSVTVTGPIVNYKGLTEYTHNEDSQIIVHKNVGVPEYQLVKLTDILEQDWNGIELLEGKLVMIENIEFLDKGKFEAWENYRITDGSKTMNLRINAEGILDNVPIPAGKVSVIGIIGQFKNSGPFEGGYHILPRSPNDIIINTKTGGIDIKKIK